MSANSWLRGFDALIGRVRRDALGGEGDEQDCADAPDLPKLAVYLLGPHRVLIDAESVSAWPNCRGKSIFNYLVAHRGRSVPKDVLMEIFWPGVDADSARNNLNASVYGLRKMLRSIDAESTFVVYEGGSYQLSPELSVWVDAEAFMRHVQASMNLERSGDLDGALDHWESALDLYQDEYLADERYGSWMCDLRRRYEIAFLQVCMKASRRYLERGDLHASMHACLRALDVDSCNEQAHVMLMRCYARLGQPQLAIRQFHACRDAQRQESGLQPSVEAISVFERLRRRQEV